ncbi:hypothetical protein KKA00_12725 [bacterium]|nr:hypothetical protein [bacterium]
MKANRSFISTFGSNPQILSEESRYNIFTDYQISNPDDREQFDSLQQGNRLIFSFQSYSFPVDFCTVPIAESASHRLQIILKPIHKDGKLQRVGVLYNPLPGIEVEQIQKAKQKRTISFAESVVELKHDVNNPLLLITGNAQLMLSKVEDLPPGMEQKLKKMLSGAEKINRIIEQFCVASCAIYLYQEEEEGTS